LAVKLVVVNGCGLVMTKKFGRQNVATGTLEGDCQQVSLGHALRFDAGYFGFGRSPVPCPLYYGNTSWKKTLFWVGSKGTQT
jgi:hypothetical protein